MDGGRQHVSSSRIVRLIQKMAGERYRNSYVVSYTKQFLAKQMRAFRGEMSQSAFGKVIGQPQSIVSRFEDPNYGRWTLTSLFDVAHKLNVAVIVRLVDFDTFVKMSEDMSDDAMRPKPYNEKPPQLGQENAFISTPFGAGYLWRRKTWGSQLFDKLLPTRKLPRAAIIGVGATGGSLIEALGNQDQIAAALTGSSTNTQISGAVNATAAFPIIGQPSAQFGSAHAG